MDYDVIVVGGGPSGMAAAIESSNNSCKTLLLERADRLGGILNQCIHSGFGVHYFKEELTGPEYAHKFIELLKKTNVEILLNTFVTNISKNKVSIINRNGAKEITAKAIVLAMGSREKTAGSIFLNGTRPVGVYTAGAVQKMINIQGKLPGKNVVILGSGDIGLIMARRLTFEGSKVKAVFEIMNTSSGLERNIKESVIDNNIPLNFSTTITRIKGKNRIEGVYYAKVDDKLNPIYSTEKYMPCDALLLSVGLMPEMDIAQGVALNKITKGAVVDEYNQTSIEGIFSAGNVLHIHDLVDNASNEAMTAGKFASIYAKNKLIVANKKQIDFLSPIKYVVPKYYYNETDLILRFRYSDTINNKKLILMDKYNNKIEKNVRIAKPNELQVVSFKINNLKGDLVLRCE